MNKITKILLPLMLIFVFSACGGGSSEKENIEIIPPPVATVSEAILSWSAPSKNTDGSDLYDLTGYKIYYGEQAENLSESITISDPAELTYKITDLKSSTTYYFSITSINSFGEESELAGVVSKTTN